MKEKLVELLDDIQARGEAFTDYEIYGMRLPDTVSNEDVASHLIANGVTVQEWISVKDRLPEEGGSYLVFSSKSKTVFTAHYWQGDRWANRANGQFITHWMPLPQPPKGE
jgi:hypothetical protein